MTIMQCQMILFQVDTCHNPKKKKVTFSLVANGNNNTMQQQQLETRLW